MTKNNHWNELILCESKWCNNTTYDYEDSGYGPVCQECAETNCEVCLLRESEHENQHGQYICQDCYESACCAAYDSYKDSLYD